MIQSHRLRVKINTIALNTETIYRLIVINTFLVIVLMSTSCGDSCDQSDSYLNIEVDIEVERLEDDMKLFDSWQDTEQFFDNNRVMADHFLDANQYPNDTILARRLFNLLQHPSIDTLITETEAYYSEFEDVTIPELEMGFRYIKSNYPTTKVPRVQTIITGFYNDMYVSDSLIILGLDFLMGVQGRYQANDVPGYIVKRYMKESVVPMVLCFVSNEYNMTDNTHGTLLADMINLGKSYYFVSQALPCKADSLIIGYTTDEMNLVRANQEIIWANLIENELLYDTNHFMKNKFISESPNVYEISEECPGRIGAWLGWEIVKKYMDKNPEVSIVDLMNDEDAHRIFQRSGYKPRNEI